MRALTPIGALLVTLLLLAMAAGCVNPYPPKPKPGIPPYEPPEGLGLIDAGGLYVSYMPFVEDVQVPEGICADESFRITMRISAEFRPIVLKGNPNWHKQGVFGEISGIGEFSVTPANDRPEYGMLLALPTAIMNPPGSGAVCDKLVFDIPGLPAGKHLIWYGTTRERRLGGVGRAQPPPEHSYLKIGDSEYEDAIVAVELPFEVLPAVEEDE